MPSGHVLIASYEFAELTFLLGMVMLYSFSSVTMLGLHPFSKIMA